MNSIERHDRVRRIGFHYVVASSLSSGSGGATLIPSQFPQLDVIADSFALYRFADLKIRLLPNATRTGLQSAGYYPGQTDVPPANGVLASVPLSAVCLGATQTTPTEWCPIDKLDLQGYLPWYKTKVGTPAQEFETQGTVYVAGANAEGFALEMRGVIEFKNPVNTTSTPMLRGMEPKSQDRNFGLPSAKLATCVDTRVFIPSPSGSRTPGTG